jgi:hypothetical protein
MPVVLSCSAQFLRLKTFGQKEGASMALSEAKAWIVTGDTSSLTEGATMNDTNYMDLMAVLNLKYAQTHGYGYTRFKYGGDDINSVCAHPSFGSRHASWCKLLVVAKVMQEAPPSVEHVLWLDTDAVMQKQQLTIPEIIDILPSGCGNRCNTTECQAHRRSSALLVLANYPFCQEPGLCAVNIWKRHSYEPILKMWWNYNQCRQEFPW